MAPGPTSAAESGLPPRGDLAGRRRDTSRCGMQVGGDGNGWVLCALGHRHWGRFGAAGILITDGARVVLQHRAPWTHEGDTWALPGGARDSHENPSTRRCGKPPRRPRSIPDRCAPYAEWVDDHGDWSYTTVLAPLSGWSTCIPANTESVAIRWWPIGTSTPSPCTPGSPQRGRTCAANSQADRARGLASLARWAPGSSARRPHCRGRPPGPPAAPSFAGRRAPIRPGSAGSQRPYRR